MSSSATYDILKPYGTGWIAIAFQVKDMENAPVPV